jgi:hypothetical protein
MAIIEGTIQRRVTSWSPLHTFLFYYYFSLFCVIFLRQWGDFFLIFFSLLTSKLHLSSAVSFLWRDCCPFHSLNQACHPGARHHHITTKNERRLAHKDIRVWVRTEVGVISCSSDNLHFQQLLMVANGYLGATRSRPNPTPLEVSWQNGHLIAVPAESSIACCFIFLIVPYHYSFVLYLNAQRIFLEGRRK